MAFDQEEKDNLYKLMAAHMHMGEMKFKQRPREEQAEVEDGSEAVHVAKLAGVDSDEFLKAILKPRVKVGTEWVNKGQNLEQVREKCKSNAKRLKINQIGKNIKFMHV